MIFCHKPYYNINYTNLIKKVLVIYALNLRIYVKHANYIMQNKYFLKNIGKKFESKFESF
jgi:hypothetical protein